MALHKKQIDYSVAIPAYGRHELIKETVRATLAQNFPPDMTWEILVNDDCTPIPLAETLREFEGRIRIGRNEKNLGFPANWNRTLNLARGTWVHMLHSDDMVDPRFAPVMWDIIKKHPKAAFIHSLTRKVVTGRPLIARVYSWLLGHREAQDDPAASVQVFAGSAAVRHALQGVRCTTVVVRRDAACGIDGFRTDFRNSSDEEYFVRLAREGEVIFCPRRLITYRYHGHQHSQRAWLRPTFVDEYSRLHDYSLKVLGDELSEQDRRIIDQRIASVAGRVAMTQALSGQLQDAQRSLDKALKRFPTVVQDPEFKKARLIVSSGIVRGLYRWFFFPRY
jgi:glycosyltransferase involved in cell wall biosynthesis